METNNNFMVSLSFFIFLSCILLVGILSTLKTKKSTEDYLLASRSVNPLVTAISAVSSLLSGFMFIAFIGFAYTRGISAIYYPFGWIVGDYVSWLFIHKKLREKSQEEGSNTITSFVGTFNKKRNEVIIKYASVISLVFLGAYAAAQLQVGSKALSIFLGWNNISGIIIAGLIVIVYCFAGGIRASIWTDVIQSIFMISSMIILLVVSLTYCGGVEGAITKLNSIDPGLLDMTPKHSTFVFLTFLVSMIANGFGVIGQPHVMVRPMLIKNPEKMNFTRNIYISWYIVFSLISLGVGLLSRIVLPELISADPETALPFLAVKLLPDIMVGLILAGIFAAALSTADSQIISCSASLTQDLFPKFKDSYIGSKVATVFVTLIAMAIAIISKQTVFDLIEIAWAALGVTIGVLLLLRCLNKNIDTLTGVIMMTSGIATVLYWKYSLGLSKIIHETFPGFIVPLVIYFFAEKIKTMKKYNS